MEKSNGSIIALAGGAMIATCLFGAPANAESDIAAKRSAVIEYWTAARRAAAQPRDMVIDHRGLGYLRRADGSLQPHGHTLQAEVQGQPVPRAKPGSGGGDTEAPNISNLNPDGATIGVAYEFSAVITDNTGLRSVKFIISKNGGLPQSFTPTSNGDAWTISLSGFTDGSWSWEVEAKDSAKGGGNLATASASFTVDTAGGGGSSGGGGGTGDTLINEMWTGGGDVQRATGRLFYEMPSNPRRKRWAGYVCSGTVVTDGATGRSVILTASHCVYDDANNAFARNVLFIPDQHHTSGTRTDSNCDNDPIGCWVADFGVVDVNWTTSEFPSNKAWDYGFYVVSDSGAHRAGLTSAPSALDAAVNEMTVDFTSPDVNDGAAGAGTPDFTHGMGYSYSDDPYFMYCAEDMTTEGGDNWWLPSCELSGGSSGGPWFQPLNESNGNGPVISVNSWGYTTSAGMAGPILSGTSAQCVFDAAIIRDFPSNPVDGDAGYAVNCQ